MSESFFKAAPSSPSPSLPSSGKGVTSNEVRRRSRAKVQPTLWDDVEQILEEGLRQQDINELAAQGHVATTTLVEAVHASGSVCFTIHVAGVPSAIFGVVPSQTPNKGSPWLLGTDRLLSIRRELVVESRIWIDWLSSVYPVLENYVDERNTVSVAWLEAMGFIFDGGGFLASHHDTKFRRFSRCANPSP